MYNLIQIELMKIYRRPGTWMMFGLLFIMLIGFAILSIQFMPANQQSFGGLMEDYSIFIVVISLFTIIVAGGIVSNEFTWGTIKLLLIRPVNRTKILLAKYLATFLFSGSLMLLLFVTSFLISGILHGFSGINDPFTANVSGELIEGNTLGYILSLYGLRSVELIMMATLSFMISTIFRSSSLATGLSLFSMFVGGQIVFFLSRYEWVKYILFTNTDLIQYVYGEAFIPGMTLAFSIVVLVVYFAIFNLFSWFVFNKRDISA